MLYGLFTLDKFLVFCAFSDTFLSIFWSRTFPNTETKSAACQKFCAQFVRFLCQFCTKNQKNHNVRNSVQILCHFCAKFGTKNINTQETQKSGSENFSLDRNFWHNSSQILDRKVSENGTESRFSSSVNSPLEC